MLFTDVGLCFGDFAIAAATKPAPLNGFFTDAAAAPETLNFRSNAWLPGDDTFRGTPAKSAVIVGCTMGTTGTTICGATDIMAGLGWCMSSWLMTERDVAMKAGAGITGRGGGSVIDDGGGIVGGGTAIDVTGGGTPIGRGGMIIPTLLTGVTIRTGGATGTGCCVSEMRLLNC